ncbi:MAG: cupin domain-containing protein [Xanthomonadales bacterium]|nr:cupin domain-containing protein [Xanthomonadales bacterium]
MSSPLGSMEPARFLADYWQRKPCLLRRTALQHDFPLDGNDLAGLACEELTESRLISGPDSAGLWQLEHGPFAESRFTTLGSEGWTLLVQDVEKHYAPLQSLLARFNFLPSWRLDDLMISFAAPGGSVGAHVDQYDVFLLQVQGRRRWDITEQFDPRSDAAQPIDMLASFQPQDSWILEPGDMLYLPPGVAHHGVALDPCLTASIGFRAPSALDLSLALGESLTEQDDEGGRYRDPALQPAVASGEVDAAAQERFRQLLLGKLNDPELLADSIGRLLSRFRQAHEPAPPPQLPGRQELEQAVSSGQPLTLHPWARPNWHRQGADARLFLAGRAHACSTALAAWLCAGLEPGARPALDHRDSELLVELLLQGQLLLAAEP